MKNNNNNNSNNNIYKCYIINNNNKSYVGITNNLERRIRQHNNIIKGGAKYTTNIIINQNNNNNINNINLWNYVCYIDGFKTKKDALQFEWSLKHCYPRNKCGIENRIGKIYNTLNKKNWTKKSVNSYNYKLILYWCNITYIPDNYDELLPNYITQDIDDIRLI